MASITFQVPDQDPFDIDLEGREELSIGRGPDNDVVLDHVSLSGSHAVLRQVGDAWQLEDRGSTNGTFVDGSPITESALGEGTQILFGNVGAVFSLGGEPGAVEGAAALEGAASDGDDGEAGEPPAQQAELAEVSNRPSDFKDLSPIEKVEKKDVVAQVAIIVGAVAILAAIALIAISATMSAA